MDNEKKPSSSVVLLKVVARMVTSAPATGWSLASSRTTPRISVLGVGSREQDAMIRVMHSKAIIAVVVKKRNLVVIDGVFIL
jgi:hypothetical protein